MNIKKKIAYVLTVVLLVGIMLMPYENRAEGKCEKHADIKEYIRVTNVYLDLYTLDLSVGETYKINAYVFPADATDKSLIWNSTDTNIAVVDQDGHITAKALGECRITATSVDSGIEAYCAVYVINRDNPIIPGDVTGNGGINTADAVVLLRHIANIIRLSGDSITAADANKDGKVNTADVVTILKHCSGIEFIPGAPIE